MRSLQQRVFLWCGGILLGALVAATLASYLDARGHVRQQSLALLNETAIGQAQAINTWMEAQQGLIESLAPQLGKAEPEARPYLAQAAVAGKLDLAYIGYPDKRMVQHKDSPLPEGYDPTQRPWYQQAAAAQGVVLTEPYVDASTGAVIVTFAKALREGSSVQAVVASDVFLTSVVDIVKRVRPTPSGFGFLVAGDGRVMAHADLPRINKPAAELVAGLSPQTLATLARPGGEWLEAEHGAQTVLLRAAPIGTTGWLLVVASDAGEALAALRSLLVKMIAVAAVALVAAAVLLRGVLGRMMAGLRRIREAMDEVSAGDGDLTARLPVAGNDEVARIAEAFNSFVAKLQGTLQEVQSAAGSISVASGEIAMGAQDLSRRTEQTASNLQQASSSMEQLTQAVRQSADAAQTANQLSQSAAQAAQQGGTVVGQVVQTMQDISTSSRRIGDIIGTIDGIAFQTNILALNAAVEAARAGEQGRGFAVVAGEVRLLAQRSAEAAKEIKGLIQASVERVESGSQLVAEAGQSMDGIVDGVRRVTDVISEISAASSEQSQGIGTVNTTMNELDQATQQNAALVEQSAAAAESLKDQAQRLTQIISVFKVD